MKILIDIAHPAHIHYFRNFSKILKENGHECLFTLRDKGIIVDLANYYKINYKIRSQENKSKIKYMLNAFYNVYKIAKEFQPDFFIDAGTVIASPISKIMRKPYIALEDTEVATKALNIFKPFADSILTPECFYKDLGKKQIRFNGLLELLYLHTNYFKKDIESISPFISNINNFVLIRFVSWEAHHDVGKSGISFENKLKLIEFLSKKYDVIISSEGKLPQKFERYKSKTPVHLMHQVMAQAKFIITEGATMASEAAVLGTPTIYINSIQNGYTNQQMSKGLILSLSNDEKLFNEVKKIERLIDNKQKKKDFKMNHLEYINDKIDVTIFLKWFVENYPNSKNILKSNPDYQNKFK